MICATSATEVADSISHTRRLTGEEDGAVVGQHPCVDVLHDAARRAAIQVSAEQHARPHVPELRK